MNLQAILDLGNVVFFTFRGRAYGIPPLAWREGERLLDAWLDARSYGEREGGLTRAELPAYFRAVHRLQRLIWRNCRPRGLVRRLFRWLRLAPNPFRKATEGELGELAVFLLGRRMISAGRLPNTADPPPAT